MNGGALWYLGCSFPLFPLGFVSREVSGFLKPADVCFELPCLGLDPTTYTDLHPGGRRWVFVGSLCLWDPPRKGRTRQS